MDKEIEKENVEMRIGEMKNQLQKSYEIFMNANAELSKLSFDNLKLQDNKPLASDVFESLNKVEINEILAADSVDDSIKLLRSKISDEDDKMKNAFPDLSKLLKIMSNLQTEMNGLKEKQNIFAKLANDVNEEMNRFEKEIDRTATQLSEITGEHTDEEEGVDGDDEISDSFANQIDLDDDFDSEFCSD